MWSAEKNNDRFAKGCKNAVHNDWCTLQKTNRICLRKFHLMFHPAGAGVFSACRQVTLNPGAVSPLPSPDGWPWRFSSHLSKYPRRRDETVDFWHLSTKLHIGAGLKKKQNTKVSFSSWLAEHPAKIQLKQRVQQLVWQSCEQRHRGWCQNKRMELQPRECRGMWSRGTTALHHAPPDPSSFTLLLPAHYVCKQRQELLQCPPPSNKKKKKV